MQTLLNAMTGSAAILNNERSDILAANQLGRALYADIFRQPSDRRTAPGSPSSTQRRARSTATGTPRRTTP